MAWWIKEHPEDLSSVPRTHVVETSCASCQTSHLNTNTFLKSINLHSILAPHGLYLESMPMFDQTFHPPLQKKKMMKKRFPKVNLSGMCPSNSEL